MMPSPYDSVHPSSTQTSLGPTRISLYEMFSVPQSGSSSNPLPTASSPPKRAELFHRIESTTVASLRYPQKMAPPKPLCVESPGRPGAPLLTNVQLRIVGSAYQFVEIPPPSRNARLLRIRQLTICEAF